MKKITLCIAIGLLTALFLPNQLSAQKKPFWEITPNGGMAWMRNTSLGNVILSTSSGLQGLDPATGKVNWTIAELANAPEQSFEEIKNTPFIAVSPKDNKDQLYIIEPFEGKILFSSRESNISQIASKYFLYQNSAIIVVGFEGAKKEPIMACIDMGSGKKLWSKSSDFSKVTACVAVNEKEMVLSTLFFTYKINAKTGDEVWKQSIDPAYAKFSGFMSMLDKGGANLKNEILALLVQSDFADGKIYMAAQVENKTQTKGSDGKTTTTVTYDSFYNAFNISDGSFAWKQPVKVNQKLGTIIPCKEGLVICAKDKSDVTMLDYNSGESKWGKKGRGIDVKGGPVTGAALINNKVLLTSGDKDSRISLINPVLGENSFPKSVKIDGQVESIIELPKGILISSNEETDYINKETGESFLEKPLKAGSGLVKATDNDIYIFNLKDGLIYKLGKNETAIKAITSEELKFEGKEDPTSIDVLKEGIFISSDQNISLVDFSGKTIFKKYYPAPRESGFKRALLYASAARAAYYSVALGYTSAVFGATSSSIRVQSTESKLAKDVTGDISKIYGKASSAAYSATNKFLAAANKRFKATAENNDFMYVLTEASKKEYHLVKVSKSSGQTIDEVNLGKDKEPKYELDNIENVIYYEQDNKIKAYKL